MNRSARGGVSASRQVGVENSDIADQPRKIMKDKGLADLIELYKGHDIRFEI